MISIIKIVEYGVAFFALYITVFFLLVFIKYRQRVMKSKKFDKENSPSVSIIIPAYNEEEFIEKCVKSALDLDYPKEKLEVIVVDDGSTDRTPKIVESLKVKYYRKKNSGKADALNYGIEKAKGEFIATLDADSYVNRDALWKLLSLFEDEDTVAVTAAVKVKQRKQGFWENIQKVEYLFTIFSRKILTFMEAVPVTPGPFSIFRASIFKKIGGFDRNSILEDQEIALRIQKYNYKIRSSLDAEVYTEVPQNFPALFKQRIRWHRGGLHNTIKYLNLISPHYGDFGLIIMPLSLIAIIALFGVFLVAFFYFATNWIYGSKIGVEVFWLSLSPLHIVGSAILILNLVWIFLGLMFFKKENVSPLQVVIYMVSYAYLLTLYWAAALFKEIKFEKVTW